MKWKSINHDSEPVNIIDNEHKFYIYDGLTAYLLKILNNHINSSLTDDVIYTIKKVIITDVQGLIDKITTIDGNLIIIKSETNLDIESNSCYRQVFQDILGSVNQRVANSADEVYLSVCGIQLKIK